MNEHNFEEFKSTVFSLSYSICYHDAFDRVEKYLKCG